MSRRKKEPGVEIYKGDACYIVSHTRDWAKKPVYQKTFKKKEYGGTGTALENAKKFAREKAKKYHTKVKY